MRSNTPQRFHYWIFSAAFFPLCLGGFALGTSDIIKGYQSLHWTQVPAEVLSAEADPNFLMPDQPEIRYEYIFEKNPYVSNRIWSGNSSAHLPVSRHTTSALLEKYAKGKTIPIYVNGENPIETAIVPGPGKAIRWMTIFSFFILFGYWSPVAIQRWRK